MAEKKITPKKRSSASGGSDKTATRVTKRRTKRQTRRSLRKA